MYKLLIADDEGKTTVVPLVRDEITIGRKEGNTIRLTDRNVSRRHAKLLRQEIGFLVEDLDSYNGVRLNGVPVLSPRPVSDGDQLSIGDYQVSLRSDRPVAAAARPTAAEPPPYPRLVMLSPPDPGTEFALNEPEIIIGRTDENSLVINHRSISRSHAKVVVENNVCRLYDMESANGVRVNGEDYREVELRRGDLVELGTVRLRFVGAGEFYQFDADATVQIDALPDAVAGRRSPLMPIVIGLVLVGLVGVGIYLVMNEDSSTEGGQAAVPDQIVAPTAPDLPSGPSAADVKAKARSLIDRELYTSAVSTLSSLGPTADEEVRQLIARANSEHEALQLWQTVCEGDSDPNDVEVTYATCKQIDPNSRYRKKGCCSGAAAQYGNAQIDEARSKIGDRDFDNAVMLAMAVADDRDMPAGVRARAQKAVERARKLQKGAPGPGPRKAVKDRRPPPTPPTPPASVNKVSAAEALASARQAIINGDQNACVRELQKAPKTGQVVRLLVTCYQRANNLRAACRLARRYPGDRTLRQFVEARCE